ncbi:UDP-2,4-diacetamido-2,4,6-trideoxy-beta-L-altropyranose hydrolase [Psychrobacter sp. PL15]|nr:UDP-2,4-diacetamido-2,4,6-trideoxy-beta-L-altropyranose hydrolase [Psychrobacter sp. PL15]
MAIQSDANMKVVFRCDASLQIGTGHVMRCLTLADALTEQGAECHFICREHTGQLLDMIQQRGHQTYSLPVESGLQLQNGERAELAHADWLGSTQQKDAELCGNLLQVLQTDWLIVDHYALDEHWEKLLRPYCKKLMVIDDLADRHHNCDILLDQTFGRDPQNYVQWVPRNCKLLCGANYALLRPEFSQWREYSIKRREKGQLEHLLINLGGVDKDNVTTQILKGLQNSALPDYCKITVVMGSKAPWVDVVQQQAALMRWPTEVKKGVSNMAELMANSDLAIGAAGSTSWERCCLGLPTIMLVLADNQQQLAINLQQANAVYTVNLGLAFDSSVLNAIENFILSPLALKEMSQASSDILDGLGTSLTIKEMVI